VSKRAGLIHYVAMCCECDAHVDARNAMVWAARHADSTGHVVEVQLGYRVHPDPFKMKDKAK
jgi:hypothetical protein